MPSVEVKTGAGKIVTEVAGLLKVVLTFFTAGEIRKRRKVFYEGRVRKAISLQEEHYTTLDEFIDWVTARITIKDKKEMKKFHGYKKNFKNSKAKFFKLT